MGQAVTPQSLKTFTESVNQQVTTPPDRKMAKVAAYAQGMGEGSIITVPVDIELFSTEMAIYLELREVHRSPEDKRNMYLFVHEVSN